MRLRSGAGSEVIDSNVVNGMYIGQTSGKLIGGGGYGMMSVDMNVAQQSLMMDPDCLSVCLSVCPSLCLHLNYLRERGQVFPYALVFWFVCLTSGLHNKLLRIFLEFFETGQLGTKHDWFDSGDNQEPEPPV